jgi:hypothetical protein
MKSKAIGWTARIITVFTLESGIAALAQDWTHKEFRGEINAYAPQTTKRPAQPPRQPVPMRFEDHGP